MPELLTRCRPLLGTFVEISADCEAAIDAAFDAVAVIHSLMSAHEPQSDISRINRFGHESEVEVNPATARVLGRALFWRRESDGAFDMLAAGAAALRNGYLPLHAHQPEPAHQSGLILRTEGPAVRLTAPGCVDVGGIAKGFAVDEAVAALKVAGANCGLVNAGGDIAAFGPDPWSATIVEPVSRQPVAEVEFTNGSVATSAVLPGGSSDHLLTCSRGLVSASVCGPSAMDCDALAKIVLAGHQSAARCLALANARAFTLSDRGEILEAGQAREAA